MMEPIEIRRTPYRDFAHICSLFPKKKKNNSGRLPETLSYSTTIPLQNHRDKSSETEQRSGGKNLHRPWRGTSLGGGRRSRGARAWAGTTAACRRHQAGGSGLAGGGRAALGNTLLARRQILGSLSGGGGKSLNVLGRAWDGIDGANHTALAVITLRAVEPEGRGVVDLKCPDGHRAGGGGGGLEAGEETGHVGLNIVDGRARVAKGSLDNGVVLWVEVELNHRTRRGNEVVRREDELAICVGDLDDLNAHLS